MNLVERGEVVDGGNIGTATAWGRDERKEREVRRRKSGEDGGGRAGAGAVISLSLSLEFLTVKHLLLASYISEPSAITTLGGALLFSPPYPSPRNYLTHI